MGCQLLNLGFILCWLCVCVLIYYGNEDGDDGNDDDDDDDNGDSDISLLF
jgi:hypothetical protein